MLLLQDENDLYMRGVDQSRLLAVRTYTIIHLLAHAGRSPDLYFCTHLLEGSRAGIYATNRKYRINEKLRKAPKDLSKRPLPFAPQEPRYTDRRQRAAAVEQDADIAWKLQQIELGVLDVDLDEEALFNSNPFDRLRVYPQETVKAENPVDVRPSPLIIIVSLLIHTLCRG